jgi:hypothetical protein
MSGQDCLLLPCLTGMRRKDSRQDLSRLLSVLLSRWAEDGLWNGPVSRRLGRIGPSLWLSVGFFLRMVATGDDMGVAA